MNYDMKNVHVKLLPRLIVLESYSNPEIRWHEGKNRSELFEGELEVQEKA